MKEIFNKLFKYQTLTKEEAKSILTQLTLGEANNSEIAAFITVFLMRNITVAELSGFRDAMLDLCKKVPSKGYDLIDLCGTGGDGKDTFNISTLSSFVVAGAGQMVAKHGNYGVSSSCGSSNILEYFECKFNNDIDCMQRNFETVGISFLHAPLFHPAMKNVAPIRKELGIKTFFNMLGPMVNPAFPQKQIVGVFSLELARLYGYLYQETDKKFIILHSLDGYDEVSLTGDCRYITQTKEGIFNPESLGFSTLDPKELASGNNIESAAKIFTNVLENKSTEAQKNVVLANAGLALSVSKSVSFQEGIALAKDSLESGKALKTFKKFVELNQ